MIGTKAMLVARETVHPAIINLLIDAAREIHGGQGVFETAGEFPGTARVDLTVSPFADQHRRFGPSYLYRVMPFWAAALVERAIILLIPLLVVLVPAFNLLPRVLRWRARSRLVRWYGRLALLERDVSTRQGDAPIEQWTQELAQLSSAASASRTCRRRSRARSSRCASTSTSSGAKSSGSAERGRRASGAAGLDRRHRRRPPGAGINARHGRGIRTDRETPRKRRGQPRRLPRRPRAAVPAARVLHRGRHDGADPEGGDHALPRPQHAAHRLVSGRGRRGVPARGLLVHDRPAVRRHLPEGRGHRAGDDVPVLRAGREHPRAGLHEQRHRPRPRDRAPRALARVRHRHRARDGAPVPRRRRGARPLDRHDVRRAGRRRG